MTFKSDLIGLSAKSLLPANLALLHSERPKLYTILAFPSEKLG